MNAKVIVFPGQSAADRPEGPAGLEWHALPERLHLLSCGLYGISPSAEWTARQWMIASTQYRMRSAGTRSSLARLAGSASGNCAIHRPVEIGYACLNAERALQAVGCCLDELMSEVAEAGTRARAARKFITDRRAALAAMDDVRLVIAREVSGA